MGAPDAVRDLAALSEVRENQMLTYSKSGSVRS